MITTEQIKNHLTANMEIKKKDIIIGNFLGGLSWGVGTVVGATVIVAFVGGILSTLGAFDSINNFIDQLNAIKVVKPDQLPNIIR